MLFLCALFVIPLNLLIFWPFDCTNSAKHMELNRTQLQGA